MHSSAGVRAPRIIRLPAGPGRASAIANGRAIRDDESGAIAPDDALARRWTTRTVLAIGVFLLAASSALAKPPSEASIERLRALVHVEKMADAVAGSMEPMMQSAFTQALGETKPTPAQQHAIDTRVADFTKSMKDELSPAAMRSTYTTSYQEAFTQEELDGMLKFYESPAGLALINKMPLVIRRSVELMQARRGPLMQKFQESARKATAEIKASDDTPAAADPPT